MANRAIFSGTQSIPTDFLPNTLPSTFGKRRILVWSGDRGASDTLTSFTVQLGDNITQAVYAEWVSCSLPGYCIEIKQFPNNGMTSKHSGFTQCWRFVSALTNAVNYTTQPFPDQQWNPTSLTSLTVNVFNPDGTTPTLASNWMMEIDVWYIVRRY
jgi:hypothetical protein